MNTSGICAPVPYVRPLTATAGLLAMLRFSTVAPTVGMMRSGGWTVMVKLFGETGVPLASVSLIVNVQVIVLL